MRLVLHREIPEDNNLARQWNELVWQMECPEVFYTYEWALAVSRAYRDSITPLLMLAYEQDSLVGVVSLATNRSRREALSWQAQPEIIATFFRISYQPVRICGSGP